MQTDFYKRYMRSKEWDRKRELRLEIDGHKCVMCDRPESKCKDGLQIHHVSYRNLGDEDVFNDIVCLCPRCHRMIHKFYKRRRSNGF